MERIKVPEILKLRGKPMSYDVGIHTSLLPWLDKVSKCSKCPIAALNQYKIMFRMRRTDCNVDVVFIGEAPGSEEYISRRPFTGPAGQELNRLLAESIDNTQLNYAIYNTLACTPWQDESRAQLHTPSISEISNCRPHVVEFLEILRPRLVVSLGRVAERCVLAIMKKSVDFEHVSLLHPSAIIQSRDKEYNRSRFTVNLMNKLNHLFGLEHEVETDS